MARELQDNIGELAVGIDRTKPGWLEQLGVRLRSPRCDIMTQNSSQLASTPGHDSETGTLMNVKNILVATDFSPSSEAALSRACTFAHSFQAQLHLVHVVSGEFDGDANRRTLEKLGRAILRMEQTVLGT